MSTKTQRPQVWKAAYNAARSAGHNAAYARTVAERCTPADVNALFNASLRFKGACRELGLDPEDVKEEALANYATAPDCVQDYLDDPALVSPDFYAHLRDVASRMVCED
jgi:hypothetical protein